jgi:hypothetical protein
LASRAGTPRASDDGLTAKKGGNIGAASNAIAKRRMPTAVVSTPAARRSKVSTELPLNRLPSLTDVSQFLTAKGVLQTVVHFAREAENKVKPHSYF